MQSFDPSKLFVQMAASLVVGLAALSLLSLADRHWASTVDPGQASAASSTVASQL